MSRSAALSNATYNFPSAPIRSAPLAPSGDADRRSRRTTRSANLSATPRKRASMNSRPPRGALAAYNAYIHPVSSNFGSSAMASNPPWGNKTSADTSSAGSRPSTAFLTTRTVPPRSATKIAPSGLKAISDGICNPSTMRSKRSVTPSNVVRNVAEVAEDVEPDVRVPAITTRRGAERPLSNVSESATMNDASSRV